MIDDDDFSSKKEIEIAPGISLSREDLNACIKLKGSLEKARKAMVFIQGCERRKCEITDWPNALAKWKVEKNEKENIELSAKLCRRFEHFRQGSGWRCLEHFSDKRGCKGLLFECENPHQKAVFIAFSDGSFESKCQKIIEEKIERKKGVFP